MENKNKLSNPLQKKCIYRVTTACHKNINGIWSYRARIFYRKGQTKAIQEIAAGSFKKLIADIQVEMDKITKQQS